MAPGNGTELASGMASGTSYGNRGSTRRPSNPNKPCWPAWPMSTSTRCGQGSPAG